MDSIIRHLSDFPLFRSCNSRELEQIKSISRVTSIRSNQSIDIRKLTSLNIIVSGTFVFEYQNRTESIYLNRGSFFGELPFVESRNTGIIKAVTDSQILVISTEDLNRFLLKNFKALRAFFRAIEKLGLDTLEYGKSFIRSKPSVMTVFSQSAASGNSLFCAHIAHLLSKSGKTIVLDLTYERNSIFSFFGRKITPAISQKSDIDSASGGTFHERIEAVHDNLDLLNISHGSNVRVDPEIVSPILLLLSARYKYIVIDLSNDDTVLRDRVFDLSDTIMMLVKHAKDLPALYGIADKTVFDGQRVYYVLNRYYTRETKVFSGGFIWESMEPSGDARLYDSFVPAFDEKPVDIIGNLTRTNNCLVISPRYMESAYLSGLFTVLADTGADINYCCTSSLSYAVLSLYLSSKNNDDFIRQVYRLFSSFNQLLEIDFPVDYVFKKNRVMKFSGDLAHDSRIECFRTLPLLLASNGSYERRIFSTGYLRDLMAVSLTPPLLMENIKINDSYYNSGYPRVEATEDALFRLNIDTIVTVNIRGHMKNVVDTRMINFYKQYLDHLRHSHDDDDHGVGGPNSITIEVDESLTDIRDITALSGRQVSEQLKAKKFFIT